MIFIPMRDRADLDPATPDTIHRHVNPLHAPAEIVSAPENRDRGSEFPPTDQAAVEATRDKANTLFGRIQSSLSKAGIALPRDRKPKLFRREVSQEALDIIKLRRSQVQGCRTRSEVIMRRVKNLFRPLLSRQARTDWRNQVTRQIDAVVEAAARSDSKAWWVAVHRFARKSKRFNSTAPAADSTQELAER